MIPQLFLDALSLAILGLSIASGVSQAYPESDGSMPSASRDFVAQGMANVVGWVLPRYAVWRLDIPNRHKRVSGREDPVGKHFRRTSSCILPNDDRPRGGERSPWLALQDLLVYIGFSVLRLDRIVRVWNTYIAERAAMLATFALTLLIPLHWAIFAGVALTLLLYVYSSSSQVRLVRIVRGTDGGFEEQNAPARLTSNEVTALHAHGNGFFAAVATLEALLPAVEGATNAVVLFGLRGRESITTSGIVMLERYTRKLQAGGNKLMLVGVEPRVRSALDRTGITSLIGEENLFASTSSLGGPLNEALTAANEWVARKTGNCSN